MAAAGEAALDARYTMTRSRREEDWRKLEASMQRMRPTAPRDAGIRWQQLLQLLPEQLRPRLERHLEALLRGDRVDREELASLVTEAGQLASRDASDRQPSIDRARLEAQWRTVEASMERIRPAARRNQRR